MIEKKSRMRLAFGPCYRRANDINVRCIEQLSRVIIYEYRGNMSSPDSDLLLTVQTYTMVVVVVTTTRLIGLFVSLAAGSRLCVLCCYFFVRLEKSLVKIELG